MGDQKYCILCHSFFDLDNSQALEWHDRGNCRREIEEERKKMKSNNIYKAEDLPEKITPAVAIKIMKSSIDSRELAEHYGGPPAESFEQLKRDIEYYRLGLYGKIPEAWNDVLRKADPEYSLYLKLKKKFE